MFNTFYNTLALHKQHTFTTHFKYVNSGQCKEV
jgi:hypothetical protein